MTIEIRHIPQGWFDLTLTLFDEHHFPIFEQNYLYYSEQEALRDFKAKTGIRYRHGIKIQRI